MYTFHLTIDVRSEYYEGYEAYKLSAIDIAAQAPGHVWSIVLHAAAPQGNLYYQISGWHSESELDRCSTSVSNLDLVERARPYAMMNTAPALRETGALAGETPMLNAVELGADCLHRTHRFVSDHSMARMIEFRAGCNGPLHTHILMKVDGELAKLYEIVVGECRVPDSGTARGVGESSREIACRIVASGQSVPDRGPSRGASSRARHLSND